jgi:hypothetical protein
VGSLEELCEFADATVTLIFIISRQGLKFLCEHSEYTHERWNSSLMYNYSHFPLHWFFTCHQHQENQKKNLFWLKFDLACLLVK